MKLSSFFSAKYYYLGTISITSNHFYLTVDIKIKIPIITTERGLCHSPCLLDLNAFDWCVKQNGLVFRFDYDNVEHGLKRRFVVARERSSRTCRLELSHGPPPVLFQNTACYLHLKIFVIQLIVYKINLSIFF